MNYADIRAAICYHERGGNPGPAVCGHINGNTFELTGATVSHNPVYPDGTVCLSALDRDRFLSCIKGTAIRRLFKTWSMRDCRIYTGFYVPIIAFESFTIGDTTVTPDK